MSIVAGNYFDKYRSTNPLHLLLMRGFIRSARALLASIQFETVLELGCGSGDLACRLFSPNSGLKYLGIDISIEEVEKARLQCPAFEFRLGTAYDLPLESHTVDLCLACEVLEHLHQPYCAITEMTRVTKPAGCALISVPWEPMWRCLNMCRGKYMRQLGNTPGHLQHFSRRRIRALVEQEFTIERQLAPFPWTMLLARRKAADLTC